VANILIETGYIRSRLIDAKTLLKLCLVKNLPLFKTECLGKLFVGVYGISIPVNIPNLILRTLVDRYIDLNSTSRCRQYVQAALRIREGIYRITGYPEIEKAMLTIEHTQIFFSFFKLTFFE